MSFTTVVSWALILLAVVFLGYRLIASRSGGSAATPAVFVEGVELTDALAAASPERPVFAYFTADWCGPCQIYKRNTLSDAQVESFVRDRFEPVYIDVDKHQDIAARYSVHSIPFTAVLDERGQMRANLVGVAQPEELVRFLEGALEDMTQLRAAE